LGKNLLIVATLDTKGREASYVKDCVRKLGITPLVMDVGILGDPLEAPDITRTELAELAGYHLDQFIKKKDRSGAVKAVQEGGIYRSEVSSRRRETRRCIRNGRWNRDSDCYSYYALPPFWFTQGGRFDSRFKKQEGVRRHERHCNVSFSGRSPGV
jgi:hypothetical protein